MAELDEIDRKILAQLIENSKIQSKELSRKLRIHPNTLLQRLKKLEPILQRPKKRQWLILLT